MLYLVPFVLYCVQVQCNIEPVGWDYQINQTLERAVRLKILMACFDCIGTIANRGDRWTNNCL